MAVCMANYSTVCLFFYFWFLGWPNVAKGWVLSCMAFLCYSSDPKLINVCLEINSGKRRSKRNGWGMGIGLRHSFLGFKNIYKDIVVHTFKLENYNCRAFDASVWIPRAEFTPTQIRAFKYGPCHVMMHQEGFISLDLSYRFMQWKRLEDPLASLQGKWEKKFYL